MAALPPPGIDAFHKERSKCVDAFAHVELAVIELLERSKTKFGGEPFGRKIELLENAAASSGYSKKHRACVHALLPVVRQIGEKRNDIVHSTLRLVTIDRGIRVQFNNLKHRDSACERPLQLSLDGIRQLAKDAHELADSLRSCE